LKEVKSNGRKLTVQEPGVRLLGLIRGGARVAVSERLLEILACPVCKVKVELKPDASGLKCIQCKRVYPIKDDIPVMLIDEAVVEE
jgi:uncharacterized protein